MKEGPSDRSTFENRLEMLRQEGASKAVKDCGIKVAGGPIPTVPQVGYYNMPIVKPPVWTWEVPLYFFIGGLAGMSAVVGLAAWFVHELSVARAAMAIAVFGGCIISPILLVMDLGRPTRFLNMLRVFKWQSLYVGRCLDFDIFWNVCGASGIRRRTNCGTLVGID